VAVSLRSGWSGGIRIEHWEIPPDQLLRRLRGTYISFQCQNSKHHQNTFNRYLVSFTDYSLYRLYNVTNALPVSTFQNIGLHVISIAKIRNHAWLVRTFEQTYSLDFHISRVMNTQLFKYQYSLLAFLAKNELDIKIFYIKIIFLVIKICLMGLFAIFLKLGQMFILKYDFFGRIFPQWEYWYLNNCVFMVMLCRVRCHAGHCVLARNYVDSLFLLWLFLLMWFLCIVVVVVSCCCFYCCCCYCCICRRCFLLNWCVSFNKLPLECVSVLQITLGMTVISSKVFVHHGYKIRLIRLIGPYNKAAPPRQGLDHLSTIHWEQVSRKKRSIYSNASIKRPTFFLAVAFQSPKENKGNETFIKPSTSVHRSLPQFLMVTA